ncbi:MAG: hypothetical protein JO252_15990 [Planctomycetaceae bacterium]|nr:hypothetical protein [Planctomycetaceae bacterium]
MYLPDELAEQVRAHQLPVSALTQQAVREALTKIGDKPKGTRMASKLEVAPDEQIKYVREYFDNVRKEFDEKASRGVLRGIDVDDVFAALQRVSKTLEASGFAHLTAARAAATDKPPQS